MKSTDINLQTGDVTVRDLAPEEIEKIKSVIMSEQVAQTALFDALSYSEKRALSYPPFTDYLDGVVKGDQAQIDAYINTCRAIKDKYPKP